MRAKPPILASRDAASNSGETKAELAIKSAIVKPMPASQLALKNRSQVTPKGKYPRRSLAASQAKR